MKLGSILLPHTVLLLFAVIVLSFALARYLERRGAQKTEPVITHILIVALVAARLFFVWRYRTLYLDSPLTILDIRDGGWDEQAGVIAAWLYTFVLTKRMPKARTSLVVTVGVASMVWISGSLVLLANTPTQAYIPARQLQELDGRQVTLTAFSGKPTVMNFWATWCPPCQREMPAMAKVQRQRPDVTILFVNQGEARDTVEQFLAAGRLDLQHVLLDQAQSVARDFTVMGYPTTMFFDARGKLVYQHTGPLSEAALLHHLEKISPTPHS